MGNAPAKAMGFSPFRRLLLLAAAWAAAWPALGQAPLVPAPFSGPREMLDAYDIDESHLRFFRDGEPLGVEEDEILAKILFRMPRFDPADVGRWRKKNVPWSRVIAAPGDYRAEFFHLAGRVERIELVQLIPELEQRFDYPGYYRVHFRLDEEPYPVLLCARAIPAAWKPGRTLDQRASCDGLFLKVGDSSGEHPRLVFAATRVAWHPDRTDDDLKVPADRVYLGELGMDMGLFDQLEDRGGMGTSDREAFYQLLAAVGRADAGEIRRRAPKNTPLGTLLNDYRSRHGLLHTITGTARRAVRVRVDPPDIRERFQIDHFYEIHLFVDQPVRGPSPVPGEKDVVFNTYPVTFVCRRLPPGMPEGDNIAEQVRVSGFFYKMWAYRSQFMAMHQPPDSAGPGSDRSRPDLLQVSPMLVGVEPEWIGTSEPYVPPWVAPLLAGLLAATLVGVWYWLWRSSRSDTRFEREVVQKRFELPPGQTLDELEEKLEPREPEA
jgi:hypothetical protein